MPFSVASTPRIKPYHLLSALLGLKNRQHPAGLINIDQLYYAVSMLAKYDCPEILGKFDFWECGFSLHSKDLEDFLNLAAVWGQISFVNKTAGNSYRIEGWRTAYENFPDQELIDHLLPKFEQYLKELIKTDHLPIHIPKAAT